MVKALCVLAKRITVTWEDYYLTLRVALDTIPKNKLTHIFRLLESGTGLKTSEIANKYIQFVQKHNDNNSFPIHPKISNWPDTSWKKIYTAFLVKENLYTVYRRG